MYFPGKHYFQIIFLSGGQIRKHFNFEADISQRLAKQEKLFPGKYFQLMGKPVNNVSNISQRWAKQ
jgi:hypothetical protein